MPDLPYRHAAHSRLDFRHGTHCTPTNTADSFRLRQNRARRVPFSEEICNVSVPPAPIRLSEDLPRFPGSSSPLHHSHLLGRKVYSIPIDHGPASSKSSYQKCSGDPALHRTPNISAPEHFRSSLRTSGQTTPRIRVGRSASASPVDFRRPLLAGLLAVRQAALNASASAARALHLTSKIR